MPRRTHDDSLETKKNILASAQRLFTRRGFERTSLSDIAKYAGVTRGAIYWHFENKEELLLCLIDSLEQRVSKFENKSPVSQSLLDDDYNRMNRFVKSYFELDLITHEVRENYLNRVEAAYKHYRTNPDQKLAKNKENTTGSSQKSDRATPIYNMRLKVGE